jgi:SAM-dependent methyltransferase
VTSGGDTDRLREPRRPWRLLSRDDLQLGTVSFVVLFLELALIRWISGYIINFGYFTNFILLGAFLGIGLGCLAARRTETLIRFFTSLLLVTIGVVYAFQVRIIDLPATRSAVFWAESPSSDIHRTAIPTYLLVPVLFSLTTLLFAALATPMGALFGRLPRLHAYTVNIVGSLFGIGTFAVCSLLWAPPVVWFALCLLASLPVLAATPRRWWIVHGVTSACVLGIVALMGRGDTWGPYYRQNLKRIDDKTFLLAGNGVYGIGIGEPSASDPSHLLYESPYGGLLAPFRDAPPRYESALVIGCGAGNDTAYALRHGVEEIDAVDINPWVIEVGKRYHLEKPFASPRVTTYVADGRAFIRNSTRKYDLIVYGLPDSTFNLSDRTNLRMESFLFTVEAFREIRAHLAENGVFVLYNYYRLPWVVQKIEGMLREAFERDPAVFKVQGDHEEWALPAILAVGPGLPHLSSSRRPPSPGEPTLARDDWPFLYLFGPNVPPHYLVSLGIVAFVSLLAVAAGLRMTGPSTDGERELPGHLAAFFFMGAAFLLLETRSVATFGLFFGSTWATNAVVFAAIHVSILLAIWVAARFPGLPRLGLFGALSASLLVSWVLPLDALLAKDDVSRALVVCTVAFLPIFCANVLFATFFRSAREGAKSYAFNLLGGMMGGMLEYSSLLLGYRALICLAGVFYLLALLAVLRAEPARVQAPAPA